MLGRGARAQIDWIPVNGLSAADSAAPRPAAAQPDGGDTVALGSLSTQNALAIIGLPQSDKAPNDELVDLLKNAAEIEHGLLIQYLYATYSCTNIAITGLLKEIAIEEMGHFLTIQNLLLACGQAPYLSISAWADSRLFQPFHFKLEPMSRLSLAKYTIAEMPDKDSSTITAAQRDLLPAILADATASAGQDVAGHRVGLLYMKIYWLLRESDDELPDPTKEPWLGFPVREIAATPGLAGRHVDKGFLTDKSARDGKPRDWRNNHQNVIVDPITGIADALAAIAEISAQGEGFGSTPNGHFERFVTMWQLARDAGPISSDAAVNPFYRPKPAGGLASGTEITNPVGILFAQIADGAYELALLATALNLLLPETVAPDRRRSAARAAIACMKDGLGIAASSLAGIPVAAGGATPSCGLPFSLVAMSGASNPAAIVARAGVVQGEIQGQVAAIAGAVGATQSQIDDATSIGQNLSEVIWPIFQLFH